MMHKSSTSFRLVQPFILSGLLIIMMEKQTKKFEKETVL